MSTLWGKPFSDLVPCCVEQAASARGVALMRDAYEALLESSEMPIPDEVVHPARADRVPS